MASNAYVVLTLVDQKLLVLVDSGAAKTVLRQDMFKNMCRSLGRVPIVKRCRGLVGVTGHELEVYGETQIEVKELGVLQVIIIEDLPYAMILGRDVMRHRSMILD